MAGNRIEIMDLKQIISLKKKWNSNRKIASLLGVNRNTINTYVKQFEVEGWSYTELLLKPDKELNDLFAAKSEKQIKRYEQLASEFEWMSKELCKTGCTLQTLWELYTKQKEDPYSYTQYVHHYNTWAARVKISGKLEHKAGEKLMMDYTGKKLHYTDKATGQQIPTEVYIGILPCSQYTYVELSLIHI